MPLQRPVMAAGAVIASTHGRILMVQTHNRLGQGLILPGGMVEEAESPAQAAVREVAEELGVGIAIDRLLALEHRSGTEDRPSQLQYIFAADSVFDEALWMRLQPEEIVETMWVEPTKVVERHAPAGRAKMAAALGALQGDGPVYIET